MKIGNTRCIEICEGIFAKLEGENPAGSVKDRVGQQIIEDAIKNNKISLSTTIIEATSGNTGIGLAAAAKEKGLTCKIFMPENMSKQRIALMKKNGAEVILTNASKGMKGSILAANEFAQTNANCFVADQFNNPSNVKAHYKTTAPEIFEQMCGKIDAFICGVGSGGTITGVGKFLKEQNSNIKIIAVEPANSAVLSGSSSGPHKIQGIGAGFIPSILDTKIYDEIIQITDEEALDNFKLLNNKYKISAGISSGAAFCAAKKFQKANSQIKRIVVLFADGADRYV